MRKPPPTLPPPTMQERATAAESARTLRRLVDDCSGWGDETVEHIDMSRPRRALWIRRWSKLPGFACVNGRYEHDLLPGWAYTRIEISAEMIPDLEVLAERGVRPTEATSGTANA